MTLNDEGFANFTREVTREVLGEDKWLDLESPNMGAEDFSYVLQRTPGAMVFLGVRVRCSMTNSPVFQRIIS